MKTKTIYYFTFAGEHPFSNFVVKIIAPSISRARGLMAQFFGEHWSFMHGPYSLQEAKEREFCKGKVKIGDTFYNLTERCLYD